MQIDLRPPPDVAKLHSMLHEQGEDARLTREQLETAQEVLAWAMATECRIERNDCSRLHKLADAIQSGELINAVLGHSTGKPESVLAHPYGTFVVRHDWLAAVGEAAAEVGNEFVLPYAHCAFEFCINGLVVIVIAAQQEGEKMTAIPFVQANGLWLCFDGETPRNAAPTQFAWEQIRAICVALDAQVATHTVIRAPEKLNAKRERSGLTPIFSHSVIDLSRRYRAQPGTTSSSETARKRLHFRRGHWRHYEDHKTWIKWMLVGNPELGFIDHHYTL